jgi:hypothetical protein
MNRHQRRAFSRTHRVHPHATHPEKLTHCLPKQACVLYVPSACMYVAELSPPNCRLVEEPWRARFYNEDEATRAALTFREITGERVVIRPGYCPHAEQ